MLAPFAHPPPGPPADSTFEPGHLLRAPNTLYLCAPAHDQRRLRGYFTALTQAVLSHAFATATKSGRPLDPPLLVVLDEAAHIAPLPELDGLAATCASHGIQIVTVWQDLAQVRGRYGARAPTVLNNHRAKLFLPGIADPDTLEYASRLIGDEEASHPSVTRDPTGRRSTTSTTRPRRLLPPEALRCLPRGRAVLVYGTLPPARLQLRPVVGRPATTFHVSVRSDLVTVAAIGLSAAVRQARARSSDSIRSCAFVASAAARSNSSAASASRPSRSSRSPRTLDNR